MEISRRSFLGGALGAAAAVSMPGCCCPCSSKKAKVAVQLYSIRTYIGGNAKKGIKGVGLAQALKDVAALGYKGVEFAGYYNAKPEELKAWLADAGLEVCGTHVANSSYGFDLKAGTFDAEVLKKTCEFELAYGNNLVICPGGGNIPPGCDWGTGRGGTVGKPSQAIDDFTKKLCDLYNKAADEAAKMSGTTSSPTPRRTSAWSRTSAGRPAPATCSPASPRSTSTRSIRTARRRSTPRRTEWAAES